MSLQGQSTLNDAEKLTETRKHVDYLQDHLERMSDNERGFIVRMTEQLESFGERTRISNKQLFWLRDLSLKY